MMIIIFSRIMKENIFGEGLDIPMLGIRMACQELWPNKDIPIFNDKVYKTANHFKLSTSQVGDFKDKIFQRIFFKLLS